MRLIVSLLDEHRGKFGMGDFVDDAEYALGPDPSARTDDEIFRMLQEKYYLPADAFNKERYKINRWEDKIRVVPND